MSKQFFEKEGDFLLSFGEFTPEKLYVDIETQYDERSETLIIQGFCDPSNQYPNKKPEMTLFCSPTRFGGIVSSDLRNGKYESNVSIPISQLYGELETRFVIYNEEYDILQQSDLFKIQIQSDLGEEFPNVLWLDFSERYPELKDCYWYIQADPEGELIIAFNSAKPNFKEAIELSGFGDKFRDEFLRHFRVVYCNALVTRTEHLESDELEDLLNPQNPYHYKIISQLLGIDNLDDNVWLRFAILNQEISGVIPQFDRMLKGVNLINDD